MPRKKKVETTAAQAEVSVPETVATPVKKTVTKKAPAKKEAVQAESEVKVEAPVSDVKEVEAPAPAVTSQVFIEYGGVQVSVDEVIKNAKSVVGEHKDIKIYVKPDESKAYIAFDDQSVAMDVFFCE